MLDLSWRPRAHLDRESIAIYLGYECGNPRAALDAMRSIDAALERACAFPESGRLYREDNLEHEYRMTLAAQYRIFYRFDNSTLTVYRIVHQRQDIDTYSLVGLE